MGTILFIAAAVTVFVGLVSTNVAGFNYQNALLQSTQRNAQKGQEQVQTSPSFGADGTVVNNQFKLTNTGSVAAQFVQVLFVYHNQSRLATAVEQFQSPGPQGKCTSTVLPPGGTCTYQISTGGLYLTNATQKVSAGVTTTLGNTFWFNYTAYIASIRGVISNCFAVSTCAVYFQSALNSNVAQGVGAFKLNFLSLAWYYLGAPANAGEFGGGGNVNGYPGFGSETATFVAWSVNVTNFDPVRRTMAISPFSQLQVGGISYFIVGNLANSGDDSVTTPTPFSPFLLPYGSSAILYFAAGSPCTSGACALPAKIPPSSASAYPTNMLLVGAYLGNLPFAQSLPFEASFAGAATFNVQGSGCIQVAAGNPPCAQVPGSQDFLVTNGNSYTLSMKSGFAFNVPSVYLVSPMSPSGTRTYQNVLCTTPTCPAPTMTSVSFTIPTTQGDGVTPLSPGYYIIEVTDGVNYNYVTACVNSCVSMSPMSGIGPVGTSVVLNGAGFASNSQITVTYDGTPVATAGSSASGAFSATFTVPVSLSGTHVVTAKDTSTDSASINFVVTPQITLSPTSGGTGTLATVSGNGFASGSAMTITWNGTPQVASPTSCATRADGTFSCTFVVPSASSGTFTVTATDAASHSGSAVFTRG